MEAIFPVDDRKKDIEFPVERIETSLYKVFFVNVYTIVRNVLSSIYDYKKRKRVLERGRVDDFLLDVIFRELETMEMLFSVTKMGFYVYLPDYRDIENYKVKLYGIKKNDKPTMVKRERALIEAYVNKIKKSDFIKSFNVYKDRHIRAKGTLLMTHKDYDLHNKKISVLESHSGKLVKPNEFGKRYKKYGDLNLDFLPYYELLCYLIGTKNDYPTLDRRIKKKTVELLTENNATEKSSLVEIKNILRKDSDIKLLMSGLRNFYS